MTRLNFLTPEEIKISSEFKKNGFIIRDGANKKSLNWIQSKFINLIKKKYNFGKNTTNLKILNFFHKKISKTNLNSFRLKVLDSINKDSNFTCKLSPNYLYHRLKSLGYIILYIKSSYAILSLN